MLAKVAPVKGVSGSRRDCKGEMKVKNQAAQPRGLGEVWGKAGFGGRKGAKRGLACLCSLALVSTRCTLILAEL